MANPLWQRRVPPFGKYVAMIHIYFAYKHVDKPWGGANTFIKALHNYFRAKKDRLKIVPSLGSPVDIFFMNQLAAGPGNDFKQWDINRVRQHVLGGSGRLKGRRALLVVRAVNLFANVDFDAGIRTRVLGYLKDRKTINLLNMADLVIFQSEYQREVFFDAGYRQDDFVVIHNGATPDFFVETPAYIEDAGMLKLIASSFSTRSIKRHDIIARFSSLPNVDVSYFGNWPREVPSVNVHLHGVKTGGEIKLAMRSHHYFLHPATRDACPNSVIEALAAGLPVIFNSHRSGSLEIVRDAGIALDERNLDKTINLARSELRSCRSIALRRRQHFGLEHCAEKYAEAFQTLYERTRGAGNG